MRYNMIRYDMILSAMTWYDKIMLCYDMIWYDVVWCGMMWYDVVWYDMYSMGLGQRPRFQTYSKMAEELHKPMANRSAKLGDTMRYPDT